MENNFAGFKKKTKYAATIQLSSYTPRHLFQTTVYIQKPEYDVYKSFIYNSTKLETTQSFYNMWMVKYWYIHTMEYYPMIRGQIIDTLNNLEESPENYAVWKKPIPKLTCSRIPLM